MFARLLPAATLALLCSLALAPKARAQNAEADKLNDAGKKEFKEKRYLEAYRLFKRAAELSPEGRFYFNVCFTLNYLERYQEAIEFCEKVEPAGADEKLLEKTQTVLAALRQKVPQEPAPTEPTDPANPADPNNPDDPNAADPNAAATGGSTSAMNNPPPPGVDPFAIEKKAPESYKWSVGAGLNVISNVNVGKIDSSNGYGSGAGLMGFANFIVNPRMNLGAQVFLGVNSLTAVDAVDPLNLWDIGAAVYKHFPITDSLSITGLAGGGLAFFQPEATLDEGLLGFGGRFSAGVDWAFGPNKEHVVSAAPTLTVYTAANRGSAGLVPEVYGLDHPSATFALNLGYQFRFATPFGAAPLFTLE
jgi:hypothetical protein